MNSETTLLSHYNLTEAFPTTWPDDRSGDSSESDSVPPNLQVEHGRSVRQSKSRYSVLDHGRHGRVPHHKDEQRRVRELETAVQKDEPDALGGSESVVRALRGKGLPVDQDMRLRRSLCCLFDCMRRQSEAGLGFCLSVRHVYVGLGIVL